MLIKSHMNLLIHAIVFNIPPQIQGVAWRGLEFGFKKRKTATKAENLDLDLDLGSEAWWLGSDLCLMTDHGLAWLDHGSMAQSRLSGSEARILNILARDLSLVARGLGSILAYEERE